MLKITESSGVSLYPLDGRVSINETTTPSQFVQPPVIVPNPDRIVNDPFL